MTAALVVEQRRHRHLLGPRRPRADVAEDVGHALAGRGRHHRPADAQPGRGEALRRRVEDDRVGRDVRADLGRRRVTDAGRQQLPVDLVVTEPGGLAARALAAAVLLDDHLADLPQHLGVDHRPRRVERRVDEHQARHADVRAQVVGRREEVGVRAHRDLDRARATQVRVVVVVPRRHRVDRRVAGIEHGAVRTVEQRPRAAGDQHRLDRVREPEVLRVEARDRLAQADDAVRGRIVRLPGGQRRAHAVQQRGRRGKLGRVEVADRQVADLRALRLSWRGSRRRCAGSRSRSRRARDRPATRPRAPDRRACR